MKNFIEIPPEVMRSVVIADLRHATRLSESWCSLRCSCTRARAGTTSESVFLLTSARMDLEHADPVRARTHVLIKA